MSAAISRLGPMLFPAARPTDLAIDIDHLAPIAENMLKIAQIADGEGETVPVSVFLVVNYLFSSIELHV